MSEMEKYFDLPYTALLRRDNDGDFAAKIEELPGCSAHGKTREEALANLDEAKALWIQDCLENGDPVPPPAAADALPSGRWLQRVPRGLHRKVQALSKREGVSLNQFVTSVLAEAAGEKSVLAKQEVVFHEDLYAFNAMAQYFVKSDFELLPTDFRILDTTLAGIAELRRGVGFSSWLSLLSASLPDRIKLPPKVNKNEKKTHSSFDVS